MVSSQLLSLKDFIVIGERRVNPHIAAAEAQLSALCKQYNIILPTYAGYTSMAPYIYPRASIDRMVTIGLIMNMFFYIDDAINDDQFAEADLDARNLFTNCARIVITGQRPMEQHRLYDVSQEIHRRLSDQASPAYINRFAKSALEYLKNTTVAINELQRPDGIIDIDRFIHWRERISGMGPTITLLELANSFELPQHVLDTPFMRHIFKIVSRIGGLGNDIWSYHKECVVEGGRLNFVHVLIENANLSVAEAVHEAIRYVNRHITEFLEMEKNPPRWEDDSTNLLVDAYLEGLREVILATYHWQMETNRYRSPHHPIPELRHMLPENPHVSPALLRQA